MVEGCIMAVETQTMLRTGSLVDEDHAEQEFIGREYPCRLREPLWPSKTHNGVVPKWSRSFIEFSEFRESDKSLKHEWGSI